MKRSTGPRSARLRGCLLGSLLGVSAVLVLLSPGQARWTARGPMNAGHESLRCGDCHRAARGTTRQQLQAGVHRALGLRSDTVDFGYKDVDNRVCLECHERPNDRHPVFRFLEPRYEKVREELGPQRCDSCHREHTGRRVTVAATVCAQCHQGLKVKNDPIETPHAKLVETRAWETCLQCHDFHGNHVMTVPRSLQGVPAAESIRSYFEGGASPYPSTKLYPTKRRAS